MPRLTHREHVVAGLEFLGFKRVRRGSTRADQMRHLIFEADGGRHWYVGRRALRLGFKLAGSQPVSTETRYWIITAPEMRPVVFALLDSKQPPGGANPVDITREIAQMPTLVGYPAYAILNHVKAWQRKTDPCGTSGSGTRSLV